MERIIWAGFSMSLFAAILMVTKKKPAFPDRLLAAWLFLFAIDYANLGLRALSGDYNIIPSSFFLYNPALYFYAISLTHPGFKLKITQLFHLLPYLILEIAKWIWPIDLSAKSFFLIDSNLWLRILYVSMMLVSLISYNLLTIMVVHRHRINLFHFFSNIHENYRISWLLFLITAYLLYITTVSLWGFYGFIYSNLQAASVYNYVASLFLTFAIGFYGIKQEEIFVNNHVDFAPFETKSNDKYKQSLLSEQKKAEIKYSLINYFNTNKPYLNPELSMPLLADCLHIPKHQLTEVLNTEIGKNFFQFVNEYRIAEVKLKLAETHNDFSIEGIGYECGFRSKSVFFSVFKDITGGTPLQYKKSLAK